MKAKRPSNYDIMRDRMECEFAKYDQTEMIRKFSLKYDQSFLYIHFAGREYRINRNNGRVEWYSDEAKVHIHASYNESMCIFDILAYSKPDCRLSGSEAASRYGVNGMCSAFSRALPAASPE